MDGSIRSACTRRRLLLTGAGGIVAAALPPWLPAAHAAAGESRLVAAPDSAQLVPPPHPETAVWAYNGAVPGPELRVRQGERLRVVVENRLAEETTVHWHGIRVPNAMDGVPHLTQPPIAPGESFVYEFDCPDAGTFWYHPHHRSFEQAGRGLSGPVVVEEKEPIQVDRDVTWVLDDWRLLQDAAIRDDFGNLHDVSHAGRLGNTVTVNGRVPETFPVRAGERVRLRLVNVANARIFGLTFEDHEPTIIAYDGQPVEPHRPAAGRILLGPAMRADVVIDMSGRPNERFTVADRFYQGQEYRLLDFVYDAEPLRDRLLEAPIRLPDNPLPEPDLEVAERHEVVFRGGMMGGMASAMLGGQRQSLGEMMRHGMAWSVNGVVASGHLHAPMLSLALDRPYILALHNDTAWHHPIHLHGHSFRVISRNGRATRHREWQDTVLLAPRERTEIAFVADNPGDWMLHCHILEHQAGGMMGVIRVA